MILSDSVIRGTCVFEEDHIQADHPEEKQRIAEAEFEPIRSVLRNGDADPWDEVTTQVWPQCR